MWRIRPSSRLVEKYRPIWTARQSGLGKLMAVQIGTIGRFHVGTRAGGLLGAGKGGPPGGARAERCPTRAPASRSTVSSVLDSIDPGTRDFRPATTGHPRTSTSGRSTEKPSQASY